MQKIHQKIIAGMLCLLLCIPALRIKADSEGAVTGDGEVFYVKESTSGKAARSFDNASKLPVSNVRYDLFQCVDISAPNTPECPNLGMGIKYIEGDDKNPDGKGKWRYVYCTQFSKLTPAGGVTMQFSGWANKKVTYALYYGAVYYGYPCRYEPYSTGDWKMDYFVTQVAVHVLNGEFTMDAVRAGMNASSASAADKDKAYAKIKKIVDGAENAANYGGFTSDNWLDMDQASFSVGGYQDTWTYNSGSYVSGGVFHPVFKSYYGYDFCEQLTGYNVQVPEGVKINKKGKELYADFNLSVEENLYRQWQLGGKTIPVTIRAQIPRYWGAGIYQTPDPSNTQNVCFLTWSSSGGTSTFEKKVDLHIPKVTQDLTIYKKDGETQEPLAGAVFSLWGYDGELYSKNVGTFTDQGDGSYVCSGIDYTTAKDGWFLIREERAPEGYDSSYQKENSQDEEDYKLYGGRVLQMNENGFQSEKVSEPFVFRDVKQVFRADLSVRKYDVDTGVNLETAEFSVFEWDAGKEAYKEEPVQELVYDVIAQKYKTKVSLEKTVENEGKFLVKETRVPRGYHHAWSREIVVSEPGTTALEFEAPNYPGRAFAVHKKILKEEVTWEHGNPTFFFKISGTDLDGKKHTYHCFVEFKEDEVKDQQGEYLTGTAYVSNIPAGIYRVEETEDVLRYVLADAMSDQENVQVEKQAAGTVNGVEKIRALVTADLRLADGSVTFVNRKVHFGEASDNAAAVNQFEIPRRPV